MTAMLRWFRLDSRRRWRSLLVLALLVAFAAGTVMTATAGARRGASAMDRLLEQTEPATVLAFTARPDFDWDAVRALPEVEALAEIVMTGYETDGRPPANQDAFGPPPAGTEAMRTIERPVVLDGRLADPARADEIVVTPAFERTSGKDIGDTVALGLYTPEQIDTLQYRFFFFTNEQIEAALSAGLDPNEVAPAAGPVVEAKIVGVVRSPIFSEKTRDDPGFVIPSAGLYAVYEEYLVGADGLAGVQAMVRLRGGEAAIPEFQEALAGLPGTTVVVESVAALAWDARDVTGFEADSLYVFAAVAMFAGVVLVGLSIARHVAFTVTDLEALQAVGLTPRQLRWAAAIGPAVAAFAGTTLGAAAAVVASRWFPVGRASLVEPDPGVDVDIGVLAPALLGVPLSVAVGAYAAAALAVRASATSSRRSVIAASVASAGLPVPVVVGARFALEPGRGRRAVPVRPALAGAVTGVFGVLAAFTFAGGVEDAAAEPARRGAVHGAEAWLGFDDVAFTPAADETLTALAGVPGVTGVNNTRHDEADAGGAHFVVNSLDSIGRPLDFVVSEGRLPAAATDVMLGPQLADELRVGVGDTIAVTGSSGEADLVVVGVGLVIPQGDDHASGALVTPAAYDGLFDGFRGQVGYIGLEPGIEPEEIIPRLYEATAGIPGEVGINPLDWLHELEEFRYVRTMPLLLAGFLALLALGAVGHALATAVRRRRGELAVLRALGLTPGQSRSVVLTQAAVLALVGLVLGVPLGVALGRAVWRQVGDALYIHYLPPTAGPALALVVPVTLVAFALLAVWPSHRAASMRVGHVLRAE